MFLSNLLLPLFFSAAASELLVDFDPSAGDDPSVLGLINLEAARGAKQSSNTPDLYINLGYDANGVRAGHFHRDAGNIRAEYHSLNGKTVADTTYYIGYSFSLEELQPSLMIWQLYVLFIILEVEILLTSALASKEYVANTNGGANIPLAFEINSAGKLEFQYQPSFPQGKRAAIWTKTIYPKTVYHVGIVINTSTPGWVELYFDGKNQKFGPDRVSRYSATTFPGRSDPKFGAYRGEAVAINTFVYRVQIGTTMADIKEAGGF